MNFISELGQPPSGDGVQIVDIDHPPGIGTLEQHEG
jgi:hypothetical protein